MIVISFAFRYTDVTPVIIYGGTDMQLDLGAKIKELRLRDGHTQDNLGQVLGVTDQAVSRWERWVRDSGR